VAVETEQLRVEPLGSGHDRSGFDSGVEPLDRYFRTQASQDARKNMAARNFPELLAWLRSNGKKVNYSDSGG